MVPERLGSQLVGTRVAAESPVVKTPVVGHRRMAMPTVARPVSFDRPLAGQAMGR